jgi:hypothetical protein
MIEVLDRALVLASTPSNSQNRLPWYSRTWVLRQHCHKVSGTFNIDPGTPCRSHAGQRRHPFRYDPVGVFGNAAPE